MMGGGGFIAALVALWLLQYLFRGGHVRDLGPQPKGSTQTLPGVKKADLAGLPEEIFYKPVSLGERVRFRDNTGAFRWGIIVAIFESKNDPGISLVTIEPEEHRLFINPNLN